MDKIYWKTYNKTFAMAILYVTNKRFYKFNDKYGTFYSFQLFSDEKDIFFNKIKQLENLKFNIK